MHLQTMEACLKRVDGAVEEYKRQNALIDLQSSFMGYVCQGHTTRSKTHALIHLCTLPTDNSYVDLYAPDRCLLKEVSC